MDTAICVDTPTLAVYLPRGDFSIMWLLGVVCAPTILVKLALHECVPLQENLMQLLTHTMRESSSTVHMQCRADSNPQSVNWSVLHFYIPHIMWHVDAPYCWSVDIVCVMSCELVHMVHTIATRARQKNKTKQSKTKQLIMTHEQHTLCYTGHGPLLMHSHSILNSDTLTLMHGCSNYNH